MNRKYSIVLKTFLFFFVSFSLHSQQWGLYTLYSVQNSTAAYLIDTNSTVYHSWTFSEKTGYSSYLLSDGSIVRSIAYTGNQLQGAAALTGKIQIVDWDGNVTWNYVVSTSSCCAHHDICPLPNGNILMIVYELKSQSEVQQAGCSKTMSILSDKIIEVKPTGTSTGTIVWEWHAWDHLCQNYDQNKDNYVSSIVQNPQLININYNTQQDWLHLNGLGYNEDLDQITVSSHYMNEVWVIDHSTTTSQAASHSGGNAGKGGDLLYRWGNPAAYSAGGTTNFNVVHDAHWVPADCPNGGYLVGFNNNGSGSRSYVDIFQPPLSGYNYTIEPGSAYEPATYSKRITCNGHTNNMGNSQQLPNGNMLITVAQTGLIYEIDASGNTIWSKSAGGCVPKAYRYAAGYLSTDGGDDPVLSVTASASPTTICSGSSVQLSSTPGGGTSYTYSWVSNPSGFTSTEQNPTVTPTATTTYTVTVSQGTSTASASVKVTVNTLPTATLTITGDTTFCEGDSVTFKAVTAGSNKYQWMDNGVDISGATTYKYVAKESGYYSVEITNSTCTATSEPVTVTVNPAPEAYAGEDVEIITGESVTLTASGGGTYLWNNSSTESSITVSPKTTAGYIVLVTNDYGCTDRDTVVVKVRNKPITVKASAKPGSICLGAAAQLNAAITDSSAKITYNWTSDPEGFTSQLKSPVVLPSETTIYYVTALSNGDTAVSSIEVAVMAVPVIKLNNPDSLLFCKGDTALLSVDEETGIAYQWYKDGSKIAKATGFEYRATVSGNYTLTGTNENGCADTSTSIYIEVFPLPATPAVTQSNDTLYSTPGAYYKWYYEGEQVKEDSLGYYVYSKEGNYQVMIDDTNGCESSISKKYYFERVDVEDEAGSECVSVYPNPSSGWLYVAVPQGDNTGMMLYFSDAMGRKLLEAENTTKLDITAYDSGVYYLMMKFGVNNVETVKIVIIK